MDVLRFADGALPAWKAAVREGRLDIDVFTAKLVFVDVLAIFLLLLFFEFMRPSVRERTDRCDSRCVRA